MMKNQEPTESLADLVKKHGDFKRVTEKTEWFDPLAKPIKKDKEEKNA